MSLHGCAGVAIAIAIGDALAVSIGAHRDRSTRRGAKVGRGLLLGRTHFTVHEAALLTPEFIATAYSTALFADKSTPVSFDGDADALSRITELCGRRFPVIGVAGIPGGTTSHPLSSLLLVEVRVVQRACGGSCYQPRRL